MEATVPSLIEAIRYPLAEGVADIEPTDADMAAINAHAASPLKPEAVFVVPAVAATPALTSYGIRLHESTLRNVAASLDTGAAYHVMHARAAQAVGYSYAGAYDPTSGEARAALFIVRGRTVPADPSLFGSSEIRTNAEIADIRQGLRREVSVGLCGHQAEYVCDVCGEDVLGDKCPHLPGRKAENGQWATCTLHNAGLIELSGVDAGACPGARFGKPGYGIPATSFSDASVGEGGPHRLDAMLREGLASSLAAKAASMYRASRDKDLLEWLDKRALPSGLTMFSIPGRPDDAARQPAAGTEETMKTHLVALFAALALPTVAAAIEAAPDEPDKWVPVMKSQIEGALKSASEANPFALACAAAGITDPAQIADLSKRAALGDTYAAKQRELARCEAVRATGECSDALKSAIDTLPLDALAALTAGWTKTADEKYGIGGSNGAERQTRPGALPGFGVDANGSGGGAMTPERRRELLQMTDVGREILKAEEGK